MFNELSWDKNESSAQLFCIVRFIGPMQAGNGSQEIMRNESKQAIGVVGG